MCNSKLTDAAVFYRGIEKQTVSAKYLFVVLISIEALTNNAVGLWLSFLKFKTSLELL